MGYEQSKKALKEYMRGWMEYYKLADGKNFSMKLMNGLVVDCVCVYGNVGKVGPKFKNLMKFGIERYRAWQWTNTCQVY